MPTNINFDKKLGISGGTGISLPSSTPSYQNEYSFQFDGVDDYIDCGDNDNLSFGNSSTDSAFSISAWVKMTDATRFRVVSKFNGSNAEYAFFTSAADQLYFVLYDNTTSSRISRYTSSTLTSYEGTWIHLAATYDGGGSSSGLKIYLNNTRIDNTTSDVGAYNAMHNTSAPFEIGKYSTSSANGLIDEVSVFNTELSASDVTTIYNSGIPNNLNDLSTPPLSWWRMGESANWDGIRDWNLVDQGTGGNDAVTQNIADSERVTDVPPNPFTNTLSTIFDGVDDAIVIGTTSLGITSAISVSAWVKIPTTNTGGGGTNIQVIACEDTTASGKRNWNMYWRGTGSNYFAFAIHHTNLSASSVVSTGIIPNDGQWHNLVGTFDGTTNANGLKLYIDGNLNVQGTAGSTGINSFTSSEPNIGRITNQNVWNFEGNIDEVAVWNSDQSANASTIYNGGEPNDLNDLSTPPLSWWRMGDGSIYPTINDEIGGNDGTMTNMTSANFVNDVPEFNTKSILLDGIDDEVSMDFTNTSTTGSISVWIKPTDYTTGPQIVWLYVGSGYRDLIVLTQKDNGVLGLSGVDSGSTKWRVETDNAVVSNGTWTHVVFSFDGSNGTIYINGLIVPQTYTITTNKSWWWDDLIPTKQRLGIFRVNGYSVQQRYNGNIEEQSVFSSALSSTEVSAIYNNGLPTDLSSESNIIAWYRMGDNDTAPTLTDNIGSNDGTMTNFTTFSTDVPT